jgi:hypothetical protein
MSFKDKLSHAIFEDDDKKKPVHPAPTAAAAATPAPATPAFTFNQPTYSVTRPTPAVTDNLDLYNQIFQKTDFDQTTAGQLIQKYSAPLASVVADPTLRTKAAVATAGQEGLTADKVLATFDGLLVALQNETQAFNDAVAAQTDHEVTQRQSQITNIQAQIQQLQQQLTQLSTDSVTAQGKISSATNQFAMVASRRKLELEQQKAQYAAMLKG